MISFQQEPWAAIREEIWPLWQMHYAEIAEDKERIPLDPDWDKYDALAKAGHLVIITARKGAEITPPADLIPPEITRNHAGMTRNPAEIPPEAGIIPPNAEITRNHAEPRELVGYVFAVVDTHLHYRTTLVAQFDLYWLRPDCRGGRTAWRMFDAMERALASLGIVKVFGNTKLAHDQGRLFRAMGWREAERLFVKTPGV